MISASLSLDLLPEQVCGVVCGVVAGGLRVSGW